MLKKLIAAPKVRFEIGVSSLLQLMKIDVKWKKIAKLHAVPNEESIVGEDGSIHNINKWCACYAAGDYQMDDQANQTCSRDN